MTTQYPTLCTPSLKLKMARRFIKSLSNIKMGHNLQPEDIKKRGQRIKRAAYRSMARAAGLRRAWSRALLFKLKNRAKQHRRSKRKRVSRDKVYSESSQVKKLRRLVPGGEAMDLCNLLEETTHYVQCLATQVKLMHKIADRCSL